MFDGIAEHEGHKTELANAIFVYEIAYFSTVTFIFFVFNDWINKC